MYAHNTISWHKDEQISIQKAGYLKIIVAEIFELRYNKYK